MRAIRDADDRLTGLFESYAPRLRSYARRHADASEADDLVADAFVVALRRPHDLPVDDADAWPWLVGTVRRLAANQRRRRASRERYALDAVRDGWRLSTVDSHEEAVAEREECLAALAALSETDRELILLTAWEGLTAAQAADVLGIRTNALAVRLHRARRRLAAATPRPHDPLLRTAALED
ncbi:MAG TPA: sigma-70 family RNA polymerase sigma factor [Nocardioides sp.]|uniref:RNA polymerase sigma factor n=1 Tax=Nocardioides sp. TaxID=35761 RepID=UPI002CE09FD0|nr:sigma-70 family RNA polymerase sigma factor [Nocardioides sp.]HTW16507.1 sigma-70 family RNA polymerase sigma factor [Nocardioides sp.]